ncbi:hypothetical protein F5I97DRAFT_1665551 [Phlebopus sp. FC_14]|nr:hypothetical protein F5I97DRAFT_1665551 [Phlebopus sp. FC_14]
MLLRFCRAPCLVSGCGLSQACNIYTCAETIGLRVCGVKNDCIYWKFGLSMKEKSRLANEHGCMYVRCDLSITITRPFSTGINSWRQLASTTSLLRLYFCQFPAHPVSNCRIYIKPTFSVFALTIFRLILKVKRTGGSKHSLFLSTVTLGPTASAPQKEKQKTKALHGQ